MKLTQIKKALLMPLAGSMDAFASGVFQDGQCLPGSLLYRGVPARPQPPARRLKGTYIFGGYLFGHWGHFLTESLSRLYAIRQCREDAPVLFMNPLDQLLIGQKQVFTALGMRNEVVLVREALEVESLIYSPPGCELSPLFISDAQLEALGQISIPNPRPERKIWLSRSSFNGGGIDNEAEIEAELPGLGWEIVHPEDLGVYEQVRLIAGSGLVAGFAGTAFLNVLLARQAQGRFLVIARSTAINQIIPSLLERKGLCPEQRLFPVEYRSGHGAGQRYFMPDTGPLLELLRGISL